MIEYLSGGGLNCPVFVCDTCRKQIVGGGLSLWACTGSTGALPYRRSPIYTVHKGDCDRALMRWFRDAYPREDGWTDLTDNLETLAQQLAHNATHTLRTKTRAHELTAPKDPQP